MALLKELLAAGPVRTAEVLSQARGQGFSERTLRRAKKKLGVVASRGDDGKAWEWAMPEPEDSGEGEKAARMARFRVQGDVDSVAVRDWLRRQCDRPGPGWEWEDPSTSLRAGY